MTLSPTGSFSLLAGFSPKRLPIFLPTFFLSLNGVFLAMSEDSSTPPRKHSSVTSVTVTVPDAARALESRSPSTVQATPTAIAADPKSKTVSSSVQKKKVSILPAVSSSAADSIYFVGNLLLIVTAVSAALGAIGVFWGDRVRDYFNDQRLSDSERAIAVANERAAELNDRATQSELALEQLKQRQEPRSARFGNNALSSLLKGKPSGTAAVWYKPENGEAFDFAGKIARELYLSGWRVSPVIPFPDSLRSEGFGTTAIKISGNVGCSIVLRSSNESDARDDATPLGCLTKAFQSLGFGSCATTDPTRPKNDILVIINDKD